MTDLFFYGKPLRFNPNNHRYYWDEKPVPSVTTIINRLSKPMLIQWAADMAVEKIKQWPEGQPIDWEVARKAHQTIKEEAGDVGKIVHRYAQAILEGKGPPIGPAAEVVPIEAVKAIAAFHDWHKQHKVEPIAVERRVFSQGYGYAGTCDFFGRIDGRMSVLDFKTGNGVYDEAWWQVSAYDLALREEMQSAEFMTRWIVHLNKTTGECVPHCRDNIDDHAADVTVWRQLVGLDAALRAARKHPQAKRKAA